MSNSVDLQKNNLEKNSTLLAEAQGLQAVEHYWHFDYISLEKSADGFEASPAFQRITFFDEKGEVLVDRESPNSLKKNQSYLITKKLSKTIEEKEVYLGHFVYVVSYKQLDEFKSDSFALALKSHMFMAVFLSGLLFLIINIVIIIPLNRISHTLSKIGRGKTDVAIPYQNTEGQIGELAKSAGLLKRQTFRLLSLEVKNRKEAEDSNRLKDLFLARMSHELRTPLHGISGCAQILGMQEGITTEQKKLVTTVQDLTTNMTQLVGDILDFSKMKFDSINLDVGMHDFKETINTIEHVVRPLITENGNKFTVDVAEGLPKFMEFDSVRLKQVIFNLLNNAGKFTHNGVVTLKIEELQRNENAIQLRMIVSDNGKGMSEEFLNKGIFNSFTQEDESISRKYGGTGLGLSIVNQIVKLMNAQLDIESETGEGSTFWITTVFKYEEVETSTDKNKHIENKSDKLLRVLIADDDAVNRMLLTKMLRLHKISATCVEDGEQAVDYVKHNDIDVVLMDVMMPKLDGIEASKKIRDFKDGNKDIPIIAVTADVKESTRDNCYAAGMNSYITKPFNADAIHETIMQVISEKKG